MDDLSAAEAADNWASFVTNEPDFAAEIDGECKLYETAAGAGRAGPPHQLRDHVSRHYRPDRTEDDALAISLAIWEYRAIRSVSAPWDAPPAATPTT